VDFFSRTGLLSSLSARSLEMLLSNESNGFGPETEYGHVVE